MAFVALIFTPRNLLIILNIYLYLSSFSKDLSHFTPADLNCKTLHVSQLLPNPHSNQYSRLNISRRSAFTMQTSLVRYEIIPWTPCCHELFPSSWLPLYVLSISQIFHWCLQNSFNLFVMVIQMCHYENTRC